MKCATWMRLVFPELKTALRVGEACTSYSVTLSSLTRVSGLTTTHSIALSC